MSDKGSIEVVCERELPRRKFMKNVATMAAGQGLLSLSGGSAIAKAITETNDRFNICFMSASEIVKRIVLGHFSAREVMSAYLDQIDRVNPSVNAICTQIPRSEALAQADAADRAIARGEKVGILHGLPIAVKDAVMTKGIRTTMGSPIFANYIPDKDALLVQRLKKAGAIVIGKTNLPEFGAGSQTYNTVFGATRNPYNLEKTVGGSSGGAAAALASGMLPIADGSDMGGSLRNPAAFCNVVGFRPSMGRVPSWPISMPWQSRLTVDGPMARTVQDAALLLSAIAGPDPRDPISIDAPGDIFLEALSSDVRGVRLAWSPDLGGLPVEDEIVAVCSKAVSIFNAMGCVVEQAHPDMSGAFDVFNTLRASVFEEAAADMMSKYPDQIKETVKWNVDEGIKLSGPDITAAQVARGEIYQRVLTFLDDYDFLILPTTQVKPFDVDIEWPRAINGIEMETYLDWMQICCVITITGLPAISVPCGFTSDGLPVGLQIVGGHRRDLDVLKIAHAFETATKFYQVSPNF